MEKLKRTSKMLDGFARVFRVIFIVFAIFLLAGAAVAAVHYFSVRDELTATLVGGDLRLNLGNVTLKLDHLVPISGYPMVPIVISFLSGAVMLAIASVEAHILHRILSPMAQGRPFDTSVSANLQKLGWLTLAQVVVYGLAEAISTGMALRLFGFGEFLNPEYVLGYTVNYRLELARFLVPAALFLLSWIFRYGEELQRQSDETL